MATIGNTVRITGEFRTFGGVLENPLNLVLRLYDSRRVQIGTDIVAGFLNPEAGVYSYDYVIPENVGTRLIYEWSGTLEGRPIIGRGSIPVRWI